MNRKTSISIITASLVLIVGVGVVTASIYLPKKSKDRPGDVKGTRTSGSLQAALDYLVTQVRSLKDIERLLYRSEPILSDQENTIFPLDQKMNWVLDVRRQLLNAKIEQQGWVVPAEAAETHSLFQKWLEQELLVMEKYFNAYNQSAGQNPDAPFTLVEAARAKTQSEEQLNKVKVNNGDLLKNKGAKFTDTDSDALPDVWEHIAGSDLTLADTDDDGLTDAEEFNTFLTKPTVPDSDADGFIDGEEVANGYNPLGEGRRPDFQS